MTLSDLVTKFGDFVMEYVAFLPITLVMQLPRGWLRLTGLMLAVPLVPIFMLLAFPLLVLLLLLGIAEIAFSKDKP